VIGQEELVVHLVASLEGPGAEEAYDRLRAIWRSCRTRLGLTHPIPGLPQLLDLPAERRSLAHEEILAGAQSGGVLAERQILLRRWPDVLSVSVVLAQPGAGAGERGAGLGWAQFAQVWDQASVGGTAALLSEDRIFLASTPQSPGSDPEAGPDPQSGLGAAISARLPYREDRSPGWAGRGAPACGLLIWDTGLRAVEASPLRELVVVTPSRPAVPLSVLTWSDGASQLPLLARYLVHRSQLRYQARRLNDWVQAGRGRFVERDDELNRGSDPDRSAAERIQELHARRRRMADLQDGAARTRADLQSMHRTAQSLLDNLGRIRDSIGLTTPGPGSVLAEDRELGEWLSAQLTDEIASLELGQARFVEAEPADDIELADLKRGVPGSEAAVSSARNRSMPASGRVFIIYAHENEQHKDRVGRFAEFLRGQGIDAVLDRNFEGQRQSWDTWAERTMLRAEFVIVVCSPSCQVAREHGSPADRNRGIRYELTLLADLQQEDYLTWQRKILPVVLSPYAVTDIPRFLSPVNMDHYVIDTLSVEAAKDLLDVLLGRPPHPLSALGSLRTPQGGPETDRESDQRADLAVLADQVAAAVGTQWDAESRSRQIDGTAQAQVLWRWGPEDLALAADDVAGQLPPGGDVKHLDDELYARLGPGGRMVMVGLPGVGKTTALIQLLLSVLHRRAALPAAARSGVAVPILLSLGSWNAEREPLAVWVVRMLRRDYPEIAGQGPAPDLVSLLRAHRIALFLDGLDEMTTTARVRAVARLDRESQGLSTVLTSRPEEYRQTLRQSRLPRAAVIELVPLDAEVAAGFLIAGQLPADKPAWSRVGEVIREDPAGITARGLNTPLTLGLARLAFRGGRDPIELTRFASVAELRAGVFEQYLSVVYDSGPPQRSERERERDRYWLSWIAHQMNAERDLLWWQIPTWFPRRRLLVAGGMVFAGVYLPTVLAVLYVSGALGISEVPWIGPVGLAIGLGALVSQGAVGNGPARLRPFRPGPSSRQALLTEVGRLMGAGMMAGAVYVALAGGAYCLITSCTVSGSSTSEKIALMPTIGGLLGIVLGAFTGVLASIYSRWRRTVTDDTGAGVTAVLAEDARSMLTTAAVTAVAVVVAVAGLVRLLSWNAPAGGWMAGIGIGSALAASCFSRISFWLPMVELALACVPGWARGRRGARVRRPPGPVRFSRLVDEAAGRGLLRRAGAAYQFRHADLQDHLAASYRQGGSVVAREHVRRVADLLASSIEAGWLPGAVQRSGHRPDHDLVLAYRKLAPGGRLLVTGPAGAGKTAALLGLQMAVLRRRGSDAEEVEDSPVPVWLSLDSWDPDLESLRFWAVRRIVRDHPWLGARRWGAEVVAELLRAGAVALFLDGLDQVPAVQRLRAGQRLMAESTGLRIVVSARPGEVADLLGPGQAPDVVLIRMTGAPADQDGHDYRAFLAAAYPDRVVREHAVHWLGWLAARLQARTDIYWWNVPGWLPPGRRRGARALLLAGSIGTAMALSVATDAWLALAGGVAGALLGLALVYLSPRPLERTVRERWRAPRAVRAVTARSDQQSEIRELWTALVAVLVCYGPLMMLLGSISDQPYSRPGLLLASPFVTFGLIVAVGDLQADLLLGGRFVVFAGGRRVGYRRFLEEARLAGVLLESGLAYRFAEAGLQEYLASQAAQADSSSSSSWFRRATAWGARSF
jgi:hypothetical protein